MAFTPVTGTVARVRASGSVLSGAQEWRITKTCTAIAINHFDITANVDGVIWGNYQRGIATATVTVRGLYDTNATTKTEGGTPALRIGTTVELDLLFENSAPFGYDAVSGIVIQFEAGATIENQGSGYTATFQLVGNVPAAT